jgi:phosphoribosylanthranilate isomerase
MPIKVKICGLSTPETVDAAIKYGASHIGFNFYAPSPRSVSADQAAALVQRLPPHVTPVALFVDETMQRIKEVRHLTGIQVVQLHGEETPAFAAEVGGDVWKALPVKTQADLNRANHYGAEVAHILYDAKPPKGAALTGGTGIRFDWTLLNGFDHPRPWILAGGIDPDNVAEAVRVTGADFVDVSSGVESSPGVKDVDKIAAFLKATGDLK